MKHLPATAARVLILLLTATFTVHTAAAEEPYNIVYIMADDLGKEWVSCYGAEDIETPHIDALARSGMTFENFYCMPQCLSLIHI